MQVKDFCFLEAAELAESVGLVVSVRQAKTKRAWANQLVIIRSHSLICWLRWFLEGRVSKDLFLPMNRRRWSVLLKDALECLGLEKCNLTLGSLRRGGACHLYVVLSVPGKPRLEGYHCGPGAQTSWNRSFREEDFAVSSDIARVVNLGQAEQVWAAAFPTRPLPQRQL